MAQLSRTVWLQHSFPSHRLSLFVFEKVQSQLRNQVLLSSISWINKPTVSTPNLSISIPETKKTVVFKPIISDCSSSEIFASVIGLNMTDFLPTAVHPTNAQIPVDLFVSKKHPGLPRGDLGFLDSAGDTIYRVTHQSLKSSSNERVLLDAAGNPLFVLCRKDNGSWEGFKAGDTGDKDLMFRVRRTKNKITRTELEVYLAGDTSEDSTCDFKMKGFPFQKSCTIYKGNDIVAQTSLMYKLHQLLPKRGKFRLTIFPVSVDHALVTALIVVFLD